MGGMDRRKSGQVPPARRAAVEPCSPAAGRELRWRRGIRIPMLGSFQPDEPATGIASGASRCRRAPPGWPVALLADGGPE
ncbi:hypothetical protein GCM10027398_37170 [Azotobacter salinestris]